MAKNISLMILPDSTTSDSRVVVLHDAGGCWKDLTDLPIGLSLKEQQGDIEAVLQDVMTNVGRNVSVPTGGLIADCARWFKNLVPLGLQKLLQEARLEPGVPVLHLHIHQNVEWIPWELLHDGDNFLGLRFVIARLPITKPVPAPNASPPRRIQTIYNLLARNVLTEHSAEETVWRGTFAGILADNRIENQFPDGGANPFQDVTMFRTQAQTADIIHLTCHGERNAGKNFILNLDNQSINTFMYHINSDVIRTTKLSHQPLVFNNACSSVSGGNSQDPTTNFGRAFFEEGAVNFVGTFAPISKALAVGFAQTFYLKLLSPVAAAPPVSIGHALLETKKQFFVSHGDTDPSFLFYCLYGSAHTEFI